MTEPVEVTVYFNFRSPYCYLASKSLFEIFDEFHAELLWRPLGGWAGRSPPERAQKKRPIARQDVARFARRMGIPLNPPPGDTDPTRAGAASLLAESRGVLRPYVVEVMRAEWAEGRDIGDLEVLADVAARIGLDPAAVRDAADNPRNHEQLEANWAEADRRGAFGVPTFVVGEAIFWGQDRMEFVREHLRELRLARL